MSVAEKRRVSKKAYDLAMRLFDAAADRKSITVTREMIESNLFELTGKNGIARREGFVPGPHGKAGKVMLLIKRDEIAPKPERNRSPVDVRKSGTNSHPSSGVSISAVEQFIKAYRDEEMTLRVARKTEGENRIEDLKSRLANAKGEEFRKAMNEANAEVVKLDNLDREVVLTVLTRIKPGPESPLFILWQSMMGLQ